MNEIVIFESGDQPVEVRLEADTVWLSQAQMAELFGTSTDNISLHLKNIFSDNELDEQSTTEDYSVVRQEGARKVKRQLKHYNLDVIISVGYRVSSARATRFRQWATGVLRKHLTHGYTLSAHRLAQQGLDEAREALALMTQTLKAHALVSDEGAAMLAMVERYLGSFGLLLAYDEDRLPQAPQHPTEARTLSLDDAHATIAALRAALDTRGEVTPLFGQPRGEGLAGILGAIEQTMFGEPLYPNAQLRAAHLLYFVIKDHPFSDGNKRIGTLLFLDYLRRNDMLARADGQVCLDQNAVVALALLIAESAATQKDLLIRLTLALMENT